MPAGTDKGVFGKWMGVPALPTNDFCSGVW
ncbi:hypothetical protein ACFS07_36130 [Undibacterium arcticum]